MRSLRSGSRRSRRPLSPTTRKAVKKARLRRAAGRRYLAIFCTLVLGASFYCFTRPTDSTLPHASRTVRHVTANRTSKLEDDTHALALAQAASDKAAMSKRKDATSSKAHSANVYHQQQHRTQHLDHHDKDHSPTRPPAHHNSPPRHPSLPVAHLPVNRATQHRTTHVDAPSLPSRVHRAFSVRCFRSRTTGYALCSHRPACASAGGLVSLSTHSTSLGVERYAEESAEIPVHARLDATYLAKRRVHWWEGGVVLVHAGARCGSVVQFLRRVSAAYHAVRHMTSRYGSHRIHAVVIVAAPAVAQRLRFSRSWHRALLDALAWPGRADLRHRAAIRFARRVRPPPFPRVFVLPDWSHLAPQAAPHTPHHHRTVACFRTIAYAAPGSALVMEPRDYPRGFGEASPPENDLVTFRAALFQAILSRPAPPARRRIVYVHRARTRALTPSGVARLERCASAAARSAGFTYTRLNADGLPVTAMLAALGDAGVVVGVHGTTLLATSFLAPGAALVEILPYRYHNDLYARAAGSSVSYSAHTLTSGLDFSGLADFGSATECQMVSPKCRTWYRSDSRALELVASDERHVAQLLMRATQSYKSKVTN